MPTTPILPILVDAALRGAEQILAARLAGSVAIHYKDARELVTDADKRSDAAMLKVLRNRVPPGIAFRLEESGDSGPSSANWIGADPLDGTNHFAAGGHAYSVQAHYVEAGVPQAGVVFQPEVFLPLAETPNCLGRLTYASRGDGAFYERTEFDGNTFHRGTPRPVKARSFPATKSFVACVPVSSKMPPDGVGKARRIMESGLIAASTGVGGAGGNVMITVFGGQHVYANFGAGEDLDLIPPQVIAEEAGLTVWGFDRRPPIWHVSKQPFIVAPTPAIAEQFLQAAGI